MEQVLKTITTKKGGTVSLIKPDNGNPFFRYLAGAAAVTDSFRYIIRQHGQEDTATVNIQVNVPQQNQPSDQQAFSEALNGFLNCVDGFMDGSPNTMALTNLLGIDEGDILNDDWIRKVFENFNYFDYVKDGAQFELNNHKGQYSFDSHYGYWDFIPGGEHAVMRFPSSPEAEENDTEFIIRRLDTKLHKTDKDIHNLPLAADMEVMVGKKQVMTFRVDEIQYFEDTAVPILVNLEAMASPYLLKFNLDSKNTQEFQLRCIVSDNDGCNLDLDTQWMVNQDLKQELRSENIQLTQGALRLNEIAVEGLETLWLATKSNIKNQQQLDALLKLTCSVDGKHIGNLRYIMADEVVELAFKDGARLNVSDIFIEHFKKYFNEAKPDGAPRNNSFDMATNSTRRTVAKPAGDTKETTTKVVNNLTEAFRRRTVKLGNNTPSVLDGAKTLFKKETINPGIVSTPGIIDSTGNITPLIDTGVISDSHDRLFTVPDSIMVTPMDATLRDTVLATPDRKITAATTIKPATTTRTTTTKPKVTPTKTVSTKTATTKAAVAPKTTTVKPTSAKTTTAKKVTAPKASTVKATSAKTVSPTKISSTKTAATKSTKTIKPK